ncbi:hypothetical protein [Achromobacter animicus]|uniref:hypothetical protein n=1 Tax=Achromobacter animicus TaxID=1389935 RepID=UPI0028AF527E|nr:hypothetical protein [Achromobacter animicus]
MRERPILFSGPMVRALLAGTKTQTRRIAKPVKHPDLGNLYDAGALVLEREPQHVIERACPYGRPFDRLWVREAFADVGCRLTYRADTNDGAHCMVKRWTSSIHMPRSACRLVLDITSVHVERLQDINEADAIAEGVGLNPPAEGVRVTTPECETLPRVMFRALWDQINGAGAWDANPWVWVVKFRVLAQPMNQPGGAHHA